MINISNPIQKGSQQYYTVIIYAKAWTETSEPARKRINEASDPSLFQVIVGPAVYYGNQNPIWNRRRAEIV